MNYQGKMSHCGDWLTLSRCGGLTVSALVSWPTPFAAAVGVADALVRFASLAWHQSNA